MDKDEFPHIGGVMITNMVMVDNYPVRFLYRQNPNLTHDSGWRLLSGLETQEYVNNAANWYIYNASSVVKRDNSIGPLLLNPVGSVFGRKSQNDDWNEVDDFDFEEEMIVSKIDQHWSIRISDLFYKIEKEDDTIVFTMKDKTVSMIIWKFEDMDKAKICAEIKDVIFVRQEIKIDILEKLDLSDESMLRIGFITQESDEKKSYKVLNCSSIVDGESAMIAIYFDRDEDKDWAIETWKGITYQK